MVVSIEERVAEMIDNLSTIDYCTLKDILNTPEGMDAARARIAMRDQYQFYKESRKIRKGDADDGYPFCRTQF